jgi:hypothetical protein
MPDNNKKKKKAKASEPSSNTSSTLHGNRTATAQSGDFDSMLAELRAADVTTTGPATTISLAISSSATEQGRFEVSEETVVQCCVAGDTNRLRRWGKLGFRVRTAQPLFQAAANGMVDVIRLLVKELGADINLATDNGFTPLLMAAQEGQVAVVMCLAKEFGVCYVASRRCIWR